MINIYIDYLDSNFTSLEDEDKVDDNSINQDDTSSYPLSDDKEKSTKEVVEEEEAPVEEKVVETSVAEEAPVEETTAEESVTEEAPVEEQVVEESVVEEAPVEEKVVEASAAEEKPEFIFSNLIGKKVGMTQLFSSNGDVYPTTIIEAGPCPVTQIKNIKNDGYDAVQISFCDIKDSKTNKPKAGHYSKSKSNPKRILKEFIVSNNNHVPKIGDIINVNQFRTGEYVSITGISKGKGFAGNMKRHGFKGGTASHGKNSVMRKSGSVGAGTDPGRIFPGMKMAGRMGNEKVTIKNLQILNIDYENNLIFIKGSIPGPRNNYILLKKK